eukprot:7189650-Prymnesium_polylepis.1
MGRPFSQFLMCAGQSERGWASSGGSWARARGGMKTLSAPLRVWAWLRAPHRNEAAESFLAPKLSLSASSETRFESLGAGTRPKNSKLF